MDFTNRWALLATALLLGCVNNTMVATRDDSAVQPTDALAPDTPDTPGADVPLGLDAGVDASPDRVAPSDVADVMDVSDVMDVVDVLAPSDVPITRDVVAEDVSPDRPSLSMGARLIAPLSGARVTHQRPTLRWALPPNLATVRVEVCGDRACTRVAASWEGADTTWRPSADLAAGVYFWRVLGLGGEAPSAVWSFVVPPRSGTVDTSWNALTDLNGDGRSDVLVVTRPDGERATVQTHFGRANALPTPGPSLAVQPYPSFAALGDLDGDGYGEIGIRRVCVEPGTDRVEIYRGGPEGLASAPSHTIVWRNVTCVESQPFVGVGDVNRDGYGDLLVLSSERGTRAFESQIELHLGAPVGQPMVASTELVGGTEYNAFGAPTALGDLNGDGYADVATLLRAGSMRGGAIIPGEVRIHLGGPSGLSATPSLRLLAPNPEDTGYGMMPAAPFDQDGDGYADLLLSNAWGTPPAPGGIGWQLWLHRGGPTGMPLPAAVPLNPAPLTGNLISAMTVGTGDYDGDGRSDIAVLATQRGSVAVQLYRGGDGASATRFVLADSALAGASSSLGADANGDGRDDLVVALGSPGADAPVTEHRVAVFAGGAWPLAQTAETWLRGPGTVSMGLVR